MEIHFHIRKRHLYGFLVAVIAILGAFIVSAFGGSNPAVLGHSAAELIVNSTSVVDNSLTGADIDESTLSGTAAGLNIGGNAATASTASNSNACSADSVCEMSGGGSLQFGATCGGNQRIFGDTGGCTMVVQSNNAMTITAPIGLAVSNTLTINGGGNTVRRSTGCGVFNYLTTDAVPAPGCVSVVDTGLRVS